MSTELRPPTLEELIRILRLARNFKIRTMEGVTSGEEHLHISFTVSKRDCEENDVHVRTFGSLFIGELIENLDKLYTFEDLTRRYSNPDEKGATAADCVSFMNNELRHTAPGGLEGTMRRRFFSNIINKLAELQEWRVFVDRDRFEELRKQQARQKADEEAIRKARERQRRYESQYQQREGFYDYAQGQGQDYSFGFGSMNEEARRSQRDQFEQMYRNAFRDDGPFAGFGQRRQRGEETFFWDKATKKKAWHEILGVPVGSNKATIKSAWRKLAKTFHPDREGGSNEKMAEINAAKDEGLSGAPA